MERRLAASSRISVIYDENVLGTGLDGWLGSAVPAQPTQSSVVCSLFRIFRRSGCVRFGSLCVRHPADAAGLCAGWRQPPQHGSLDDEKLVAEHYEQIENRFNKLNQKLIKLCRETLSGKKGARARAHTDCKLARANGTAAFLFVIVYMPAQSRLSSTRMS